MDFRMLVMAGHGKNVDGSFDPGAIGCGYREADLNRELQSLICEEAKQAGIACDAAPDRNHYSFFKAGGRYDMTAYRYVLEVHFNASVRVDTVGDGVMKGSMMYVDRSETGHTVEDAILRNLYQAGSKKAWDGVVITQRQWPFGLLVQNAVRRQGVSHAVLETCFISDMDDIRWYQSQKRAIARAVVTGIIEGFGLKTKTDEKAEKSENMQPSDNASQPSSSGNQGTAGNSSAEAGQTKTDSASSRPQVPYLVKVDTTIIPDHFLNIRRLPSINSPVTGRIRQPMSLTIVAEADGKGASRWGKLKSGAGWISLDYTRR